MDKNFNKILKRLKEIHGLKSDLAFGMVMQTAMDDYSQKYNVDFHQLSSKQILQALSNFKNKLISQ